MKLLSGNFHTKKKNPHHPLAACVLGMCQRLNKRKRGEKEKKSEIETHPPRYLYPK